MSISKLPNKHNELIEYYIREEDKGSHKEFIAVFIYPECMREFDGRTWTMIEHLE